MGTGPEARIDNFGTIETHGTRAIGIEGIGGRFFTIGQDIEIVNKGDVTTEGNLAIGVSLGLPLPFQDGIVRAAVNSSIVNTGVIQTHGDGAAGVIMIGEGNHLTNSGRITTDGGAFLDDSAGLLRAAGVVVSGDGALVENTHTGVIESKNAASAAIEGGAGKETVINRGLIVGNVDLGDGADTFVAGNGGTIVGQLTLGIGDDLVRVENGSGITKIADFVGGNLSGDVIDVSAFFSNLKQLQAHSAQNGSDLTIALDNNDSLILVGVQLSTLNAGDFLFK